MTMRQYQVPQFITVEDKVIGPFTIKEFLYLGGGAGLILIARLFFSGYFLYFIALIIGSIAAALAFLKINEQSFPKFLKNALFYALRPRLYIWKKSEGSAHAQRTESIPQHEVLVQNIPKLSQSKLSDLAWSLDLKEKGKENDNG